MVSVYTVSDELKLWNYGGLIFELDDGNFIEQNDDYSIELNKAR